jgi:NTE family protein
MGAASSAPLPWWERVATLKHLRLPRVQRHSGAPEEPTGPQTAFILFGGAARGAAQAGALTVLLEHGITPDLIVGISAGAWNGSYVALEPTVERCLELEAHWRATTSQEVLGAQWRAARAAFNVFGQRSSIFGSRGVRRMADRYLAGHSFEELRVPLQVVAADLHSGEAVFFESGPLDLAVLASSAIPGLFPPTVHGERVLVDGGWAEWWGCLSALRSGAKRIVLVGCGSVRAAASKRQTFRRIYERSQDISTRQNFERTLFALRGTDREVLAIFPDLPSGSLLDFDRAPELIRAGRTAANQAVEQWERSYGKIVRPSAAITPASSSA